MRRLALVALAAAALAAPLAAPGGIAPGVRLGPPMADTKSLAGIETGKPPWPAERVKLQARLKEIGLPALGAEGTTLHIHIHLDVYVDGRHIAVPPAVGIDAQGLFISPVHTHDPSGIIHVESPTVQDFTLGQLMAVWGVRFSDRCIGGLCAGKGKELRLYVNGQRVNADPTRIDLASHDEIVVVFGKPPKRIPASFSFTGGL